MSDECRILILGGLGMVGRNLVKYLVDYQLATFIRVVDKQLPDMAYLSPHFKTYFTPSSTFEFIQADLSVEEHVSRAFETNKHNEFTFNVVINVAAETVYGHSETKYERHILQLRTLCAQKAATILKLEKYIEVSTAQVYECANDKPSKESSKSLKPWTCLAKYHLLAENVVSQIKGLAYVIARVPIVYGPGDVRGIMSRIVCAAVYESSKEKMSFLWGEDLRMHTVHAQDAAAGIWHLVCNAEVGQIYNIVDDGDTSQGSFNKNLEAVFKISTSFYGTMLSTIAKLKLEELVDRANDGHLGPWNKLLQAANISGSPLTPYIEKELLYHNPICIDGSKLKALGFQCSCPKMTPELLRDAVEYWRALRLFPPAAS